MTDKTLVTLNAHPSDPQTLVLRTPPQISSTMGSFQPARYDRAHHGYLLHTDHLDALYRWAPTVHIHVVDERRRPPGDQLQMPECANCGQPASLEHQPRRCPACGQTWSPKFVAGETGAKGVRQTCGSCGRVQRGRFAYCGACGVPMPTEEPRSGVRLSKTRLKDPVPLAETVPETVDHLQQEAALAEETTDEPF